MEVFLHKICGQPVQPPVSMQLRRCTPEQAPAVYALQNEVRAAMPDPEQFVPDTLENITAYVRNDLCIGAWQGSRLGGYLIVRFCGRSAHNYAAFMDVPRTEWEHWANADSAIVHADFRGNGLQRLMLEAALPLFPKKNHPYRCYRQPAEPVQPAQRPCVRFCHRLPAGNVRRPRPVSAGKRLVKNRAAFPNGCSPVLQSIESLSLFFILCRTTSRQARCTAAVSTQLMG